MPDFSFSCHDCADHTIAVNWRTGEVVDHCELHDRHFSKSFPMRDTPCKASLEIADHQCPECGETMTLYYSRKEAYFKCEEHGVLQADGSVVGCVEKDGGHK